MTDHDDVMTMLGIIEAWHDGAISSIEMWGHWGEILKKHPEYINGIDPTKDKKEGGHNGR